MNDGPGCSGSGPVCTLLLCSSRDRLSNRGLNSASQGFLTVILVMLGSGRTHRGAKLPSSDAVATNTVGSELGAKLRVVVRDSLGHRDKNL